MKLIWNSDWIKESPGAQEVADAFEKIVEKNPRNIVLPSASYRGVPIVRLLLEDGNYKVNKSFSIRFNTLDGKHYDMRLDSCKDAEEVLEKTLVALEDESPWLVSSGLAIRKKAICSFNVQE